MRTESTQLQLQIISGPFTERERQIVIRNLHLTNQELANKLYRTKSSVRQFLNRENITRNEHQIHQIKMRIGARQRGENNPNFKNWRSKNNYFYKIRSVNRHPEKHRARLIYQRALRRGDIIAKDYCERCGATDTRIEFHHPSYEPGQELIGIYVCKQCHLDLDEERRAREATESINDESIRPDDIGGKDL